MGAGNLSFLRGPEGVVQGQTVRQGAAPLGASPLVSGAISPNSHLRLSSQPAPVSPGHPSGLQSICPTHPQFPSASSAVSPGHLQAGTQ